MKFVTGLNIRVRQMMFISVKHDNSVIMFFFCKEHFCKRMSIKYPRILKKCAGNFHPQMLEIRFKNANFSLELFKSFKIE